MKRLCLAIAFCVSLISGALAQGGMGPGPGTVHSTGGGAYVGPGDIDSGGLGWWGLRAYSAAAAGTKSVNVCIPSDTTCADLSTDATTGNLTVTPIGGSSCAVVVCTIKTWYDQIGTNCSGSCDFTQATIGSRFQLIVNCVGSLPCARNQSGGGGYTRTTLFTQNQPFTISAVAERNPSASAQQIIWSFDGGIVQLGFWSTANQVYMYANSAVPAASATDVVIHAMQAIYDNPGSASTIYIDGSSAGMSLGASTAITVNGTHTIFQNFSGGANFVIGDFYETGIFSGNQSANNSAINSNQHSYWGF